jgi:hypothetical protein
MEKTTVYIPTDYDPDYFIDNFNNDGNQSVNKVEGYFFTEEELQMALSDAAEKALSNAGFDRFYIEDYLNQNRPIKKQG